MSLVPSPTATFCCTTVNHSVGLLITILAIQQQQLQQDLTLHARSMSGVDDADQTQRKYKSAYTPHNPIPTTKSYREEQKERQKVEQNPDQDERSTKEKAEDTYKTWKGEDPDTREGSQQVYQTDRPHDDETEEQADAEDNSRDQQDNDAVDSMQDTSEAVDSAQGAKDKRKAMKKRSDKGGEREVTDPITHLPIKIHDYTGKDLKNTPENVKPPRTGTGLDDEELRDHQEEQRESHEGMKSLFPPPNYDAVGREVAKVQATAMTVGLASILAIVVGLLIFERLFGLGAQLETKLLRRESAGKTVASIILLLLGAGSGVLAIYLVKSWTEGKVKDIWERELWEAERSQGHERARGKTPESTQWLSELLSSVWPMVNPDLFTSLADTLEDVMQASLPSLVRMVSVEDIGQGSESVRILGIKWLPTGAASQTVTSDGKLQKSNSNDRAVPGQGEIDDGKGDAGSKPDDGSSKQHKQDEQESQNISEGMEAEEGEFVNIEIAFAYKARAAGKGLKNLSKNAHLFLGFYLPGNIKLPVWVELKGIVGVMRLRLQLTPDPPFFSLCTLTFLGQPKVDMSCVPLVKKGLNLMDVPLISNFVQSAVDAAMAEYVAPKSLTLDLKEMMMGDDFKKDTAARGVLVVHIKRAFDFKEGDSGFGPLKSGSADAYVTAGWAKFGKPVWSTRVIQSDMEPTWEETGYILVSPEELNVRERLRIQLWDSDRMTADDDLGRIEADLRELMKDERSNGKMWERSDGFRSLKAGEGMPGKLDWSVGYFSKTRILEEQIKAKKNDPELQDVRSIEDLKRKVGEESARKLREMKKDATSEMEQQKEQDLKEKEDQIIIATPPPKEYLSGVLSIVIHQITGLELEKINKNQASKHETDAEEGEEGGDLPSAYCTIILNHQKVFRTRTKPKNGKPFFNAGCERFIRDVSSAEILISVRDARVHEDDALLGIVTLPLHQLFKHRSQVNDIFPLAGGVGYGKCRISLCFRSVQLQIPRELLGWDYGTIEIGKDVKVLSGMDKVKGLRLKARTSLGRGKYQAGDDGNWTRKRGDPCRLAVKKRYASPLIFEFRSSSMLKDSTPAFCIFWLKDIEDDKEKTIKLPIWSGDLKRAETNVLDTCGDKVGELELTLTFWRGLSGFHTPLANKDDNIADVMEVLDCANDNNEELDTNGDVDDEYNDTSSSSDDDGDDANDLDQRKEKFKKNKTESSLENDGKRGAVESIQEYKQNRKQLHRKNRGLMQWKGPRTVQWMAKKVERGGKKVGNLFNHHERDTDIETEV